MKKISIFVFSVSLILAALIFSGAAHAKGGKGHGKGHGHAAEQADSPSAGLIGAANRESIALYLKENYGRKCPPGLAKKNNGCLPPGLAKKYKVGQPLPDDVLTSTLPGELLKLLYPPRYGQKYIQVDKDILLIDQATRKVLDAVTLLSAVGR